MLQSPSRRCPREDGGKDTLPDDTTTIDDEDNNDDSYLFMGCLRRPCREFEELWYRLEVLELYKELAIVKDGLSRDTCRVEDLPYLFPNEYNDDDHEEDEEDVDIVRKQLQQLDEHCLSVRSLMN